MKSPNYDAIQKAMEDIRRDRYDYYLDLYLMEVVTVHVEAMEEALRRLYHTVPEEYESGVVFDSEINTDAEIPEVVEEALEQAIEVITNPDRYVRIPERSSSEAFLVMREFALSVRDPQLKRLLLESLNGAGAFRRFKDVLLKDKRERKRWHAFNAKAMKRVIDGWLQEVLSFRA